MNFEEFHEEAGLGDKATAGQGNQDKSDQPAGPTREEFAQLNNRLAEMADENRHNRQLLTQFLERQQQGKGRGDEDEGEEDDEPVDDGDIADDFAANGIQALVKRGVLTKSQARELIREEARKIAREEVSQSRNGMIADAQLARDYPDLANENSALFKRTQAIYKELTTEDPVYARSSKTLNTAARLAKAELLAEGREDARQDRINRQSGDRSYGRHSDFGDEEGDELSPTQRRIIQRFNESGEVEISEDGYRKRAQRVSLAGTGRRG